MGSKTSMRKIKTRIRKRTRSRCKSRIMKELPTYPSPTLHHTLSHLLNPNLDLTPSLFLLPNHPFERSEAIMSSPLSKWEAKPPLDRIPPSALMKVAQVMGFGASKHTGP